MSVYRTTAIVTIELPGIQSESRALTRERDYPVSLSIEGRSYSAQSFRSPRDDEQWREYVNRLRQCNKREGEGNYRGAVLIRGIGRDLFENLCRLSPALAEFLNAAGTPRRLVIQSDRPELHTLPWGALYDAEGNFAAAGDLSIAECWKGFSNTAAVTPERMTLRAEIRGDTGQSTRESLKLLPEEIVRDNNALPDILHVEAHGNAVLKEIGDIGSWKLAQKFQTAQIALLWSCYSAAANSWGESPALCLHQIGSSFVLSFQAELHNIDAAAISMDFYRDVFGPKASRDPETAIVRIRAKMFAEGFENACWASMTLYLNQPLDLSAMPLNGPRVPASGWTEDAAGGEWIEVRRAIDSLKPGGRVAVLSPQPGQLPRALLDSWKGTVIRLDGATDPLTDQTLGELHPDLRQAPKTHPADRLVWFFRKIEKYGAPLIVWSHAAPRHLEFLNVVVPPPTLTFLLLTEKEQPLDVIGLVDTNRLEEARAACVNLAGDECWQAAYFAYARGEERAKALDAISRLESESERMLLSGNYVSRFSRLPDGTPVDGPNKWQAEEGYYRQAFALASAEGNFRDMGRARLELGHLLYVQGEVASSEHMYRSASGDLGQAPGKLRDSRWHSALGRVLRDHAQLLSKNPDRLKDASDLLRRAMAIHAFHGRELQLAYSRTTAAQIALTAGRYGEAENCAIDAANTFENCSVWRGWDDPVFVLLDALYQTRQTQRMLAVADLAIEKTAASNLPVERQTKLAARFRFRKAEALWAAGDLEAVRAQLAAIGPVSDASLRLQIERLRRFVSVQEKGRASAG